MMLIFPWKLTLLCCLLEAGLICATLSPPGGDPSQHLHYKPKEIQDFIFTQDTLPAISTTFSDDHILAEKEQVNYGNSYRLPGSQVVRFKRESYDDDEDGDYLNDEGSGSGFSEIESDRSSDLQPDIPDPKSWFVLVVLQMPWNESLRDKSSLAYTQASKSIKNWITSVFDLVRIIGPIRFTDNPTTPTITYTECEVRLELPNHGFAKDEIQDALKTAFVRSHDSVKFRTLWINVAEATSRQSLSTTTPNTATTVAPTTETTTATPLTTTTTTTTMAPTTTTTTLTPTTTTTTLAPTTTTTTMAPTTTAPPTTTSSTHHHHPMTTKPLPTDPSPEIEDSKPSFWRRWYVICGLLTISCLTTILAAFYIIKRKKRPAEASV